MSYNNIQRDKFIPFWHTGNYIHIVHEKIIPVPLTVLGCEKYWNVIFFMNEIVNIIIIIKYIKPHWVASWTFQIKMLPKLKWDTKRRQLWPALASSYIQFCIASSARLMLPGLFFTVWWCMAMNPPSKLQYLQYLKNQNINSSFCNILMTWCSSWLCIYRCTDNIW